MAVDMVARFLANGKTGGGIDGYSKSEIDAMLSGKVDAQEVAKLSEDLAEKVDASDIEQVKKLGNCGKYEVRNETFCFGKGTEEKDF